MKQNKSIGLLLIFMLPLFTAVLWQQWRSTQIRKEIKRELSFSVSKEKLTFLKFHKDELVSKLEWEHDKEFVFQNEMYDVVYVEEKEDSNYYWCWRDHRETLLNQQVSTLLKNYLDQNEPYQNQKSQISILLKSLSLPAEPISFTLIRELITAQYMTLAGLSISSPKKGPDTPPPDQMV